VALRRKNLIKDRVAAGTLATIDLTQAEASYQQSRLEMHQAVARERQLYMSMARKFNLSGPVPPGHPRFAPLAGTGDQNNLGIKSVETLLQGEKVLEATAKTQDAAFYPTVGLNLSRSAQWFEGNPNQDPQNIAAVELQWTLLDGGTRHRQVADATRQRLELAAQRHELDSNFRDIRASYQFRWSQALDVLKSALSLREAALKAQKAVQGSWQAGLTTSSEVQKADEQVLQSDLGVLQGLTALGGLQIEGMMAFGKMASLGNIQ
jgi:outer membrane protein TolC